MRHMTLTGKRKGRRRSDRRSMKRLGGDCSQCPSNGAGGGGRQSSRTKKERWIFFMVRSGIVFFLGQEVELSSMVFFVLGIHQYKPIHPARPESCAAYAILLGLRRQTPLTI